MAYHCIIIEPKETKCFPQEIYEKAKDLEKLWQDYRLEWYITEEKITLCYREGWFFNLEEFVKEAIEEGCITKNMVDVYRWICRNATVESDCKNACDNEYGPSNVDDFREDIESAVIDIIIGYRK